MKINKIAEIDDGIFFPEDFKILPKDTIIYIVKGKIINIKRNENEKPKQKSKHK